MARLQSLVSDREIYHLYIFQLISSVFAAACNFVAFVSPYWIEAKSVAFALFNRTGLWTVCFDGYMRPNQYNKAYYGCYYIYYVEYDSIREWLNPIWLYFVQVIASVGLICHGLVLFFVLCQLSGRVQIESLEITKSLMAGHFLAGFALVCTLLGFLYGSYDSRWVPYPRFNKLSWAFAVDLISLLFTVTSFFILLVLYLKIHAKLVKNNLLLESGEGFEKDDEDDENQEDEIRKISSRIYSAASSDRGLLPQKVEDEQPSLLTHSLTYGQPDYHDPDIVEDLGEDEDHSRRFVYHYK